MTREEATDTGRSKVQYQHRNPVEVWWRIDDVSANDFNDQRSAYDGIEQVKSHLNPGGLEREDRLLAPMYSFQNTHNERHVHWPQHMRESRIHIRHRLSQEWYVVAECQPDDAFG